MPRKALYNIEDVMTLAADVFIEHGYHGAIMDELVARTDFNRRGLYLEFGSKQAFLHQVLRHYQTTQLDPIIAHLDQNQGLSSINLFFAAYTHHVNGRGCLLINMITELGFDDPIVKELGRHYLDRLELGFISCLEKAAQNKEITPAISIEMIALQLTSFVQGFAVNGVLAGNTDELSKATESILGSLLRR